MAIKFQYNKTSLNDLDKNLKAREKALPTIKNKESALRAEVQKAKAKADSLEKELEEQIRKLEGLSRLFAEFDASLIEIKDVKLKMTKIAGVSIPNVESIEFVEKDFLLFATPIWYTKGIKLLKDLAYLGIESDVYSYKMNLLDHARKKTTQKVNLYEKVQIPGYMEAIAKIKRFIEDEENLSKSAQKIVKKRKDEEEAL